ncbi:class I SAM-dependent methyltransferase [Staphylococcus aureus]
MDQSIEKAQENISAAGLESYIQVQQANAVKLPFDDNQFDIVLNLSNVNNVTHRHKGKSITRVLPSLKAWGYLVNT